MQSASLPVFLNTANELLDKLATDHSDHALALSREAQQLADTLRAWEVSPPEAHERATAVRALLDLQRRIMEYLNEAKALSTHTPPRPR